MGSTASLQRVRYLLAAGFSMTLDSCDLISKFQQCDCCLVPDGGMGEGWVRRTSCHAEKQMECTRRSSSESDILSTTEVGKLEGSSKGQPILGQAVAPNGCRP